MRLASRRRRKRQKCLAPNAKCRRLCVVCVYGGWVLCRVNVAVCRHRAEVVCVVVPCCVYVAVGNEKRETPPGVPFFSRLFGPSALVLAG